MTANASVNAAVVVLTAAIALPAAGAAPEPHRRLGLWETQLAVDDGRDKIPASQVCLDRFTEPRMSIVGAQMDRSKCRTYEVASNPAGGWSFRSVCAVDGPAAFTTTARITGDLSRAYSIVATGSTSGSSWPSENTTHKIKLTSRWVGACPAGMTGGDVRTAGRTYNVFAAGRAGKGAAARR